MSALAIGSVVAGTPPTTEIATIKSFAATDRALLASIFAVGTGVDRGSGTPQTSTPAGTFRTFAAADKALAEVEALVALLDVKIGQYLVAFAHAKTAITPAKDIYDPR